MCMSLLASCAQRVAFTNVRVSRLFHFTFSGARSLMDALGRDAGQPRGQAVSRHRGLQTDYLREGACEEAAPAPSSLGARQGEAAGRSRDPKTQGM